MWVRRKLRPQAGWAPIAFALDWESPTAPHEQHHLTGIFIPISWRYEKRCRPTEYFLGSNRPRPKYRGYQLADYNVVSQRLGWLPSAPHFNKNPLDIVKAARGLGCDR